MGLACPRRAEAHGDGGGGRLLSEAGGPAAEPMGPAPGGGRRGVLRERCHYMCECHVTHNFFVRQLGLHLEYRGDDAAFLARYAPEVPGGEAGALKALAEVRRQREERLQAPAEASARASCVERLYKRLRPEVYSLDAGAFLAPAFREVVAALREVGGSGPALGSCVAELKARGLLREVRRNLFCLEVLSPAFCALLESELANFAASGLPRTAPNTMNRHGLILAELGFGPGLLEPLVQGYIDVLASRLLPEFTEGLDSYRAFTVLYDSTEGGDRELASHYDNAEVTLNINIGGQWEGGSVSFSGLATEDEAQEAFAEVSLERGHGVLHAGLELHKALPITSGRRHNLIIWCRSSGVRNKRCPMCFKPPRVVASNRFGHEGFTVPPCRLSDAAWEPGLQELFS